VIVDDPLLGSDRWRTGSLVVESNDSVLISIVSTAREGDAVAVG
jgi:hypothetical protein